MNEAALLSARHNQKIGQKELEMPSKKSLPGRREAGSEKKRSGGCLSPKFRCALVAAHSKFADPVHKINIIPRGRTVWDTRCNFKPMTIFDDALATAGADSGHAGWPRAEEVVFHEVTTGAENDLEHATALARQMVCLFGMARLWSGPVRSTTTACARMDGDHTIAASAPRETE